MVFVGYPTVLTFPRASFAGSGTREEFAGLEQYERLLTNSVFWSALGNTILLGVAFLVIVIPLAAVLASMLNNLSAARPPLKVIYFLPQLTSSVAVAIMFNYVFQPDWGLLNGILRLVGVDPLPLWLANPRLDFTGSRAAVTILAVWTGSAISSSSSSPACRTSRPTSTTAAKLDGANGIQIWWTITLPSLRPTFIFLIMTGTIDALARFGDLWTLGGPGGAPARSLQTHRDVHVPDRASRAATSISRRRRRWSSSSSCSRSRSSPSAASSRENSRPNDEHRGRDPCR